MNIRPPSPKNDSWPGLVRAETDPASLIGNLRVRMILAKATDLARRGRYAAAEKILRQNSGDGAAHPQVLDLLARIRAQQGRFAEAQAFWKEAARLKPEETAYRDYLRRIAEIQKRPAWQTGLRGPVLRLGCVFGMAALLIGIVFYGKFVNLTASPKSKNSPSHASIPSKTQPPQVTMPPIPGVAVDRYAERMIFTFPDGLFIHGARLKPEAATGLNTLARWLWTSCGRVLIRIEGHTDDLPVPPGRPFRDNGSLGMQRAAVVAEQLRSAAPLPPAMFVLTSVGESQALYPNDSMPNRLRNRSVVILLTANNANNR